MSTSPDPARSSLLSLAWIGAFPLGLLALAHATSASLRQAHASWTDTTPGASLPEIGILWILVLAGPWVAHAMWGMERALEYRWEVPHRNAPGIVAYRVQVLTGLMLLAYVPWHVLERSGRGPTASGRLPVVMDALACLALGYHLGNGIRTASARWGFFVGAGPRARARRLAWTATLLGGLSAALLLLAGPLEGDA